MATSSAGTELSDSLSKLRIKRAEPRRQRSWVSRVLRFAIVSTAVLAVAATAVVWAYKDGRISGNPSWITVPEVMQPRMEGRIATVTVETGRAADATVKATGYLESRRQARIGARTPGRMSIINVEEGSRVTTGQVLAVLEHADLDASLAAVEATLSRAKAALEEQEIVILQCQREFERAERLWKSKLVAESNYDDARFKSASAVARRISLVADIALAEARGYRRGIAAYKRGDYITLGEYIDGMDRRPHRARKKVT
jgi:multidrug efflux pump subunit AcrA (membrane-fusion protein)